MEPIFIVDVHRLRVYRSACDELSRAGLPFIDVHRFRVAFSLSTFTKFALNREPLNPEPVNGYHLYIPDFLQIIEKISSKGYSVFYMKCSTFVFSYFRAFPPAKLLRRSFGALAKAEVLYGGQVGARDQSWHEFVTLCNVKML